MERDRLVDELQVASQEYVNCTDEFNERQRTYYTTSLADTLNVGSWMCGVWCVVCGVWCGVMRVMCGV